MLLIYVPLAVAGFSRTTVLQERVNVLRPAVFGSKFALPTEACRMPGLVDAEFDLAGLHFLDGLGDVGRHGAALRVRHQAARAEDLAELADFAHDVGRGNDHIDVRPPALDLLDILGEPGMVGAGRLRFFILRRLGQHEHAHFLADAVRKRDGAADRLIGLLRIDAEADGDVDGLDKLRRGSLLHPRDRFFNRIRLSRVHLADDGLEALAGFHGAFLDCGAIVRPAPAGRTPTCE